MDITIICIPEKVWDLVPRKILSFQAKGHIFLRHKDAIPNPEPQHFQKNNVFF